MLTALTIEKAKAEKWYLKILNKIRGNSICTVIRSARGVAVRDVKYICRNGSVNWYELDREIGIQRNHLLCSENIVFPDNMGFKRFENTEFKIRLTCNLALYILSKLKGEIPDLKVGIFDCGVNCVNLLNEITKYCSDISVVSSNPDEYEKTAEKITEETGIGIYLTDKTSVLEKCAFIIAPGQIRENLPVSGGAVILTSFPPTVCVPGLVYFYYHFRMPNMFDKIKPKSLSCEYFAGALYTNGRQYELGSIVPTTCANFSSSQTPRSICEYLVRTSQ